jgi:hypothetical protein
MNIEYKIEYRTANGAGEFHQVSKSYERALKIARVVLDDLSERTGSPVLMFSVSRIGG